jgi:ABC-2 type transport system permease protein
MNARRTLAISRRIADLFRRDHRTLALVFVAPIVIMAMLGWVIRDQSGPTTRVAAITPSGPAGQIGRQRLIDAAAAQGMEFHDEITSEDQARQALREDVIDIALVVTVDGTPPTPRIKVITPGINPPNDGGRVGELRELIAAALGQTGPPLEQESIYGAGDGDFFNAFAPALVGFVVFFLVFILTGISFLRERVGGTLERLLATPVRRQEIVLGYSVGFGFFAMLQVALILAFVLLSVHLDAIGPLPAINLGLGVPIAGSPILAFVITLLLAICAVNLGIFLSTFARTEFQIIQFIPLVIVPQALLSGIFWPTEALPGILEPISRVMPMTYGIDGLREVLVKGSGLDVSAVQFDIAVLAGIAILLAIAATLTIRREVA